MIDITSKGFSINKSIIRIILAVTALCLMLNCISASRENSITVSATNHVQVKAGKHGYAMSIEERMRCRQMIEQVLWKHRIWPKENPQSKPPLEQVMNSEAIRAQVQDELLKSMALEYYWHRPLTGEQLQAEMERMAHNTRQPEVLKELWDALNSDPSLIAECLARPMLADRLIRNWWAGSGTTTGTANQSNCTDGIKNSMLSGGAPITENHMNKERAFEEWWEKEKIKIRIEPIMIEYSYRLPVIHDQGCTDDSWTSTSMVITPRLIHTAVWTGTEMIIWGGAYQGPNGYRSLNDGGRYNPATDTWTPLPTLNAPAERSEHKAVWTGTEMIIWGGIKGGNQVLYNTGGRYNPQTNSWIATAMLNAPVARRTFSAVWSGTIMIIWGGFDGNFYINAGGKYDPVANSWVATSMTAAPDVRHDHQAVWTETEMIVWGGSGPGGYLNTGGRYNPVSDTWIATSTVNAPAPRDSFTALWTGSEMIVWGGFCGTLCRLNSGGKYNPSTDSWAATSLTNAPAERDSHTAIWTGTEMIVWGGFSIASDYFNTGGRYNPATDTWTPTSLTDAPAARDNHTAVWTGTEMIIWGGRVCDSCAENNGARYNPASDSWVPTSVLEAPSSRTYHTAVWTGTEMIIWGGHYVDVNNHSYYFDTGARYTPAIDSWSSTTLNNAPDPRAWHTAVWTGTEMIVWGGYYWNSSSDLGFFNTGSKYNPASNSWTAVSTTNAPSARRRHSSVWTGAEMIVWAGEISHYETVNSGGRYNPAADLWTAISTGNAPTPRNMHSAIWTGTEMIVWGGSASWNDDPQRTGGRYNPAKNLWVAISTKGAPSERVENVAVWTGTEMIIWGGYNYQWNGDKIFYNNGAAYIPITNSWRRVSTDSAPEKRAQSVAVWTGNEMIVWGGKSNYPAYLNSGARYYPASDIWVPTSIENAPVSRSNHTAVWTGSEMIVWGGAYSDANGTHYLDTGSRYCSEPATLISKKPVIDDSSSPFPNGIIEPNESITLRGNLYNTSDSAVTSVEGTLTTSDPVVIQNAHASYPDISPHSSQNCNACYSVTAPSSNRPAIHWDFTVTESPECNGCDPASFNFTYHVGQSFSDVSLNNVFYPYIEKILHSSITGGCGGSNYCPHKEVRREELAKFICTAMQTVSGDSCDIHPCYSSPYDDVPMNNIFCPYIDALSGMGIVGCCNDDPSLFCPAANVQRQAMAKFICLAMQVALPGTCITTSCLGTFADVTPGNRFCVYIEALYRAGIISGCTQSLYCPYGIVVREQMSKFLVNAFNL